MDLARQMAACPQDLRDWAEALGYKNLKQRVASGGAMQTQAAATLTVQLAALGGAGGVALQLLHHAATPEAWGALAAALYLATLVAATVHWCINLRDAPAVYNRPGNLVVPGASLEQVRLGELVNLDERIRQQTALNNRRGQALNHARLATVCALFVFAAGTAAAWWRAR